MNQFWLPHISRTPICGALTSGRQYTKRTKHKQPIWTVGICRDQLDIALPTELRAWNRPPSIVGSRCHGYHGILILQLTEAYFKLGAHMVRLLCPLQVFQEPLGVFPPVDVLWAPSTRKPSVVKLLLPESSQSKIVTWCHCHIVVCCSMFPKGCLSKSKTVGAGSLRSSIENILKKTWRISFKIHIRAMKSAGFQSCNGTVLERRLLLPAVSGNACFLCDLNCKKKLGSRSVPSASVAAAGSLRRFPLMGFRFGTGWRRCRSSESVCANRSASL